MKQVTFKSTYGESTYDYLCTTESGDVICAQKSPKNPNGARLIIAKGGDANKVTATHARIDNTETLEEVTFIITAHTNLSEEDAQQIAPLFMNYVK